MPNRTPDTNGRLDEPPVTEGPAWTVKKLLDSRDPPRFHGDTFAAFNSFTSCLRIRQSVDWYAANDGSIRSKGTMYFVLTCS